MWDTFFYILGVYTFTAFVFDQLWSPALVLWSHLKDILLPMTKKSLIEKYGNWAVITGSTDGMGKAYAKRLALKGFNIVLISRSEEKLKAVKKEIENESKVQVKYIVADFSHNFEIYERIKAELADIPVGVLVNNVGLSRTTPAPFEEHSEKLIWDMILVNVSATMLMTKIVLPGMKKRGKGGIVNISSICTIAPLINNAGLYSVCKIFISAMTNVLQWELIGYKNIHVQLLEPGFVNTNMIQFSEDVKNHPMVCSPEEFAKTGVRLLGRTPHSHGYYRHSIFAFIFLLIPKTLRIFGIYWHGKSFDFKKV